jgi:sensor histidine kinase regulating citrate/malate metabolism
LVAEVSFLIALLKYELLDVEDIVRSVTFSKINEGIFVVDYKGRLVDFNNAAKNIFEWLDTSNIGINISLFEEGSVIINNKKDEFGMEIFRQGKKKYFEFYVTRIEKKEGILGNIYIFQDITKQ